MSVINTNVNSMFAQNALKTNARAQSTAMQQLSTGLRVNSAKDDAAGLAIGQSMTSQVKGLDMAVRNANDGINMMQTAEGAMVEQTNMLQRMRELAVQAANGTYSTKQRAYLQDEFTALGSQIDAIATQTTWNGEHLLDMTSAIGASHSAGSFDFQVGQNANQTISVKIDTPMTMSGLASDLHASMDTALLSARAGNTTITALEGAIDAINGMRAKIGAGINRLTYAVDNLTNVSANIQASRSTIMDTDYATASTQLSKTQIIQQAATAMLAQANQQPQSVLSLLK
jgi:flagellin